MTAWSVLVVLDDPALARRQSLLDALAAAAYEWEQANGVELWVSGQPASELGPEFWTGE